uniref:Uncharacterized protein n=1 Tax=Anguilla anguilla TaxID=7936 RepID=A0A0E9R6N5_ANGAN
MVFVMECLVYAYYFFNKMML